jgi:UDP-N-acetylglucosamine--N-acetylmuramyl-(pentapeptide) pyrophosphoryl-undecaprenol N-acetylglucosamine transferase
VKLIVTGGGTGGHVYPALEIAQEARSRGIDVVYFGAERGQEKYAAPASGFPFFGLPSGPIYSMRNPVGWKALLNLWKCRGHAKALLRAAGAEAVFSTGGYSSAPVVSAAVSLGLPLVIHESNSVPGRTNRLFARHAKAFTTVFRSTSQFFDRPHVVRAGQPVRKRIREIVREPNGAAPMVLVLGGSQGSRFLNELANEVSKRMGAEVQWLVAAGQKELPLMRVRPDFVGNQYHVRWEPYLDEPQLVEAYARAALVLARSGGTLAEFAACRLPSVLVPLPSSADEHQLHNAREFEAMAAADCLVQSLATADAVIQSIRSWIGDTDRKEGAAKSLADWDLPDATHTITDLILQTRVAIA